MERLERYPNGTGLPSAERQDVGVVFLHAAREGGKERPCYLNHAMAPLTQRTAMSSSRGERSKDQA